MISVKTCAQSGSSRTFRWFLLVFSCLLVIALSAPVVLVQRLAEKRELEILAAHGRGTPLADVVEAHGAPDSVQQIDDGWKWYGQPQAAPHGAVRVAIYFVGSKACAFFLDQEERVIEVRVLTSD